MITTKQNWFKRSLSLLLALVMCMGVFSVTAFAEGEKTQREQFNELLAYIDSLDSNDWEEAGYNELMKMRGYIENPDDVPDAYLGNYISQLQQYVDKLKKAEQSAGTNTLADGKYVVTLNTIDWNTGKSDVYRKYGSVPFSSRALLEASNGHCYLTMRLECADYVDKIWVLDQSKNADYATVQDLWTSFGTDIKSAIEALDGGSAWLAGTSGSMYTFSDANNGNYIEVSKTDVDTTKQFAYIRFELKDYTAKTVAFFWSKVGSGKKAPGLTSLELQLDIDSIFSLTDLQETVNSGKAGVKIDDARMCRPTAGASSVNAEVQGMLAGNANITATGSAYNAKIKLAKDTFYYDSSNPSSPIASIGVLAKKEYPQVSPSRDNGATYDSCYTKGNNYITLTFDEKALIYGLDFMMDTEYSTIKNKSHYYGTIVLTPVQITDVKITDEASGIYVTGKSSILPEDAVLKIEKDRAYTEYPDDNAHKYIRDGIVEWSGTMYSDPKHWFYVTLTNLDGNELSTYDGITLHIPLEKAKETDDPSAYYICAFNDAGGSLYSSDTYGYDKYGWVTKLEDGSYEFQYLNQLGQINIQGSTFAYMQKGDYADIRGMIKSGDDDGIYTATAQLQKIGTSGSSMANAALNPNIMITIHDGIAKMYFTSDYLTIMDAQAYIGELMCYNVSAPGTWYEDSVMYTKFLTDENGNLASNCGYNPVTECANVMGGIITLKEESYDTEFNCYNLAIVPPAMLGGVEYSTIQKDELTVHLRVTNMQKVADYSEENLNTQVKSGYGFDKSALMQKIQYAKVFSSSEYTEESFAALTAAIADAKAVYDTAYDNAVTASDAYEEQIILLTEAVNALEESTELTQAKEELIKVIDRAKEIAIGDKTESAYNALQDAIAGAEAVCDNAVSTVEDLNVAVAALEEAIAAFQNSESASTLDKNNLADGVYSINADMIKMDRVSKSMADNAINHTVKLEVIDGKYFVTLDFRGITIENRFGYLKNLSYYADGYTYGQYGTVEGTLVPAEVLSTQKDSDGKDVIDQYNDANNLYPDLVRIKLVPQAIADADGYVPLHVFVPIMEAIAAGNGDQDVLMKLDWSTLKATTEEDPGFQPEEPIEQSPAVDITDAATGVKVHADKGVFEEGVKLVVTPIISGSDYDLAASALEEVGKKFKLYEIYFEDANGNEVQSNGTVTVSYPIPAGYDAANVVLYRINEDGSKTLIKGAVDGSYYTVITKSFSNYALVEKDSTITDEQNTQNVNNGNSGNSDSPQTGDNRNITLWFMLALASAGMICVLTFTRKRRVSEGE